MKRKVPDSVDDIFSFTAEETGFSREMIRFVFKNFEKNLAGFLRNPIKAGTSIVITNFVKITFRINDALDRLDKMKRYRPESKDILFYEQYLKNHLTDGRQEEAASEAESNEG